jgi:hypothetical protein
MPWPVNVYQIDLKKLDELKGEITPHSRAESDLDSGAKIALETINSRAETAALLGVPSERIVGTKAYDAFDGAVGGEVATPPTTQRSAALRIVGDDVDSPQDKTNPYEQGEIESIQQHMDDLDGYEGKATPELATRVLKALEAHELLDWNYLNALFDEYLLKAVWLRDKTQGRLDWLVDRLESKDERSVLTQFKLFCAKRKPAENSDAPSHWTCDGCDQIFACVHITCPNGCVPKNPKFELDEITADGSVRVKGYLEGPIDMGEDSEVLKYLCDWCNKLLPDSPTNLSGVRCKCPKNNQQKKFELVDV